MPIKGQSTVADLIGSACRPGRRQHHRPDPVPPVHDQVPPAQRQAFDLVRLQLRPHRQPVNSVGTLVRITGTQAPANGVLARWRQTIKTPDKHRHLGAYGRSTLREVPDLRGLQGAFHMTVVPFQSFR